MIKSLTLLFLCLSLSAAAQQKLNNSATGSRYTYIYQLTDKETGDVVKNGIKAVNTSFLHSRVDSFPTGKRYEKKLPYGHYLYAKAVKNNLEYTFEQVSNVYVQFVNNRKSLQFIVLDEKANMITDAEVNVGKRGRVYFDKVGKLYISGRLREEETIRISYKGIVSYFEYIETGYNWGRNRPFFYNFFHKKPVVYLWKPFRNFFKRGAFSIYDYKGGGQKYHSYMATDKPMYKPQDSVRFKAFIVKANGEAIKLRPAKLYLKSENQKFIGEIQPYTNGGYTYSFKLSDSLKLVLDRTYQLELRDYKDHLMAGAHFLYQEYELRSTTFTARSDKKLHHTGEPVTLYMKGIDENELPVPDGRVEVVVKTTNVSNFQQNAVVVRDTLWVKKLALDPVGETKLVLPDSIFPAADLNYTVNFSFLNSNNENYASSINLSYEFVRSKIIASFDRDTVEVKYMEGDKSISKKALITGQHLTDTARWEVTLPVRFEHKSRFTEYLIEADKLQTSLELKDVEDLLAVSAKQRRDTLAIKVSNPRKIPFWYTIFSGNNVFKQGFGTQLDTAISYSGATADIRLDYFWGDEETSKFKQVSALYDKSLLNIKVNAPVTIYPGQETEIKIDVTNTGGKPVKNVDITAYAFTSKFKRYEGLSIPYFGPQTKERKRINEVEPTNFLYTGKMPFNWEKTGHLFGLDTLEYYRFVNTKSVYTTTGEGRDSITQIAPFVVKNGAIVPVHVLYIDDVPVFFDKAEQYTRYAFEVDPGKHTLAMRTTDRIILVKDVVAEKGRRTVISVLDSVGNPAASVNPAPSKLEASEAELLARYMFKVGNNFGPRATFLTSARQQWLLNTSFSKTEGGEFLVGPIRQNNLVFHSGNIHQSFTKEAGYTFTFTPGLIKQRSYQGYGFKNELNTAINSVAGSYWQDVLSQRRLDSTWNAYLDFRSTTTILVNNKRFWGPATGELRMIVDTSIISKHGTIKNVILYKPGEPDFVSIYPGKFNLFDRQLAGTYRVLYLLQDNRYFINESVKVAANGINYYKWETADILPPDSVSNGIDRFIKSYDPSLSDLQRQYLATSVAEVFNKRYYDNSDLKNEVTGVLLEREGDLPIPGATIMIKGLNAGTTTDSQGRFKLLVPGNATLVFSCIGFETKEVLVPGNGYLAVKMDVYANAINEVVVQGAYGLKSTQRSTVALSGDKLNMNRGEAIINALAGKVPGIEISYNSSAAALGRNTEVRLRGANGFSGGKALIIVDGKVFTGDIATLDVLNAVVMSPDGATAIYGQAAANGAIIITTTSLISGDAVPVGDAGQQTMRTNFSDSGFWKPILTTDENGSVTFKVKFPDDITKWQTRILAMNDKKQIGYIEFYIRSFKSLSANLLASQFAVEGDSLRVIGKLMNYTQKEEQLERTFSFNGTQLRKDNLAVMNAHLDSVTVAATATDSLKFEYTLLQQGGYFDGERRSIPVIKQGVLETKGVFAALTGDTTVNYAFDQKLGKITLRAESSVFPVLLDEITKLRNYKYLCNEQLASKLKALLLEKRVRTYLKQDFDGEKDIKNIIKQLNNSKLENGTWGWWKDSAAELWITLHVVEALLEAEKEGYPVNLNKVVLRANLIAQQAGGTDASFIYRLRLLKLLDEKTYVADWVIEAENAQKREETSLYEKLLLLDLKQQSGLKINIDSLLALKKHTMFGNIYWGEENTRFWDNSIQNTVLVYRILHRAGAHEAELEKILGYFLEQRKDGQWRNTYESAKVLDAIIPELIARKWKDGNTSITVNGTQVSKFPYDSTLGNMSEISITKTGKMPVYFTAYQQFTNQTPEKTSKDFVVNTSFVEKGAKVAQLTGGKPVTMRVEVEVKADADYVMIEVPIPAGCSYENKMQAFWGVETHREYFKEKTAIFCTKLKQGKYTFDIDLMPRYGGNYTINPAKAELMYFPVFFGREGMKRVVVR